jgi:hypothetical protein
MATPFSGAFFGEWSRPLPVNLVRRRRCAATPRRSGGPTGVRMSRPPKRSNILVSSDQNTAGGNHDSRVASSGAAGAPELVIPDEVAEAGWSELTSIFDLSDLSHGPHEPLEAIKRAYLAMNHLLEHPR